MKGISLVWDAEADILLGFYIWVFGLFMAITVHHDNLIGYNDEKTPAYYYHIIFYWLYWRCFSGGIEYVHTLNNPCRRTTTNSAGKYPDRAAINISAFIATLDIIAYRVAISEMTMSGEEAHEK
ncbi:hypothetical protein [Xenorhabdus szentirmaii]|uniref:Uncharacterized protein n=2 Tax=Xenorhabdus szentirmaii TaxID=290112 RepID=W1IXB9_9GAMM|nr:MULTISPECIES: hypothetical protein [Xenorhabdus]MBD2782633.1 hypothetical protein [Xenorhabdus sp. 38]MBD2794195.1 hypothetical protein [Xenorhabdus sp. CUL]MBD2798980.1 hypothetical protein [Xenorhabdus sp. M]MBD2806853.1 hypothetical protein [Xenorhabdus sp. ZM]MBD2821479.1 hypothetical protein [Xenorhabdus sp. 42]